MTIAIDSADVGVFLAQFAIAAARTMVLGAIVALLLIALRIKGVSVRLFAWTAVLYAGLSMPVLAWLLPPMPVHLPFLRSTMPVEIAGDERASLALLGARAGDISIQTGTEAEDVSRRPPVDNRPPSWISSVQSYRWTTLASGVYLAIALFLLFRLLIGVTIASRLVRSSNPIHDSRVTVWLSSRTHLIRRRPAPHVRESELVTVPLTIGVFSPTILLPSAWREWDDSKLNSVLAHEVSHIARWDCLTQYLSLLHRAIFWFSPLAWWLNRQIIELAEQVSDEAVLSGGVEQNQYARTLLGFLKMAQAVSGRVRWQGVSMASLTQAEKRLEKILAWKGEKKMRGRRWILVVAAAVMLPTVCLIAAGRPAQDAEPAQSSNSGAEQAPQSTPATSAAPVMPAAPTAATPAMPAAPESPISLSEPATQTRNHRHGYFYSYGFDDEQRFVIVSGKTDGFTMSGSSEDARHAEKLKQRISGGFIWFQRDEKSYIIRDQATVERARQLWAPQEELGKKQEELGKQQEALGKQQEELGARMQRVRVKVPDMTAELDKLKAELKQLGPDATMEQIGRLHSEIGELQSRIGEIQSHAGDEQGKLGEEMGALGEQQGKLGAQQGELGRQQGELAEKATQEMKQLLDDAIKKGTAQPEGPETGGASL